MKINNIFNEKIDTSAFNNILIMLNAKPIKTKAKTILIKDLLLLIVRTYRYRYLKMKKTKKGGDPDSCYFTAFSPNPINQYLNTSTLNFNNSFPPQAMTYYREFI